MTPDRIALADYAVVGLYLVAVLAAGFWFTRLTKGGRDFFVGGNHIPWWVAGVSLYMTVFSAWMFTGAASFVYNTGWFGILFLGVKPVGFIIGFLLSAVRWRRSRVTSPVEYVEERFNHPTRLLLSIVLVVSMMYWPGHHLAAVAKISAPALFPETPWAVDALVLFFGVFVLLYTVAGGLWAVAVTDVLQFLVLFSVCLVLVPVIFLSGDVGGPVEFAQAVPALELQHTVRETTVYTHWYIIGFAAAGVFGNVVGDKAQRFFSVRDESAARKTGWLAFWLFVTWPILFGLPPLVGKVLWPAVSDLPFFVGTAKPDETIFIAVVMQYLPAGVVGLFLAAMIAASMSALDSVWNTVSAIVSVDLYKGHIRRGATDRELLIVGRAVVVVLCLVALTTALLINHSSLGIFTISNIVMGLVAIPVTIPLLVGLLSRFPSTWSAIPAILGGTAVSALTRFALDWTLGPQYLSVVVTCLLLLFVSRWLGQLHERNRMLSLAASLGVGAILWSVAALVTAPTMTAGITRAGADSIWTTIVALFIAILCVAFSPVYAREHRLPATRVDEFFRRLERPIDADNEVGPERGGRQAYRIVGWSAIGLGILPIIMLATLNEWGSWQAYVGLSAVLLGGGGAFLRFGRRASNS